MNDDFSENEIPEIERKAIEAYFTKEEFEHYQLAAKEIAKSLRNKVSETVLQLIEKWEKRARNCQGLTFERGTQRAFKQCANELRQAFKNCIENR